MTNIDQFSKYSVAIIGLGRIGMQMELDEKRIKPATHFGSYYKHSRISKMYLCDSNRDQLWDAKKIGSTFNVDAEYFLDYKEAIAKRPDIVVVATGSELHCDIVCHSAQYVKAIVCEKPIAMSVAGAQVMIDTCEKHEVPLIIDHCRRFLPLSSACKRAIEEGEIGEVKQISAFYTAGIMNSGTHLIDMLRFLNGDIAKIDAALRSNHTCPPDDMNVDGIFTFKNNSRGVIQSTDVKDYAIFDIHIYGTEGLLTLHNFGFKSFMRKAGICKTFGGYKELYDEYEWETDNSHVSMWGNLATHVIECLDQGYIKSSLSSGEDGLEALRTVLSLMRVAERNDV